ncbi:MAG: ABC transporter permease [Caldilineaceae bacterium]
MEGNQVEVKVVGVVDEAALISPMLPTYADHYQLYDSEAAGKAALREKAIAALMIMPSDYMATGRVTVMTMDSGGGFSGIAMVDNDELSDFLRAHLLRNQVDPALQERIIAPYHPQRITLEPEVTTGAEGSATDEVAAVSGLLFGYFFGIILGIAVFTSAGYLLQGVARDKSDRIVSLLSSVSKCPPTAGRQSVGLALGLTQLIIWLGSLLVNGLVGTTMLGLRPTVFGFIFCPAGVF